MNTDDDDFFYEMQPSVSGLTLSQMNNKSSVLCPETQDITSQYLVLQQLDAHQKMISRAKGCVDTSPPKSMQSYRCVSQQKKKKMLKHFQKDSQIQFQRVSAEDCNRPSSSRLAAYNSEEDDNGSTDASFVNKAIQTGIPVANIASKTAEKISWYLEALSLEELHSEYFTLLDNASRYSRQLASRSFPTSRAMKKVVKGDIMDWHREHFIEPKSRFSPRILVDKTAKSKIRDMRCYNPPFRKKKAGSSHSTDTFESFDEEDNEEENSQTNENLKSSDYSSVEDAPVTRRLSDANTSHYNSTIPLLPHYRRDHESYSTSSVLNKNEEDKYLDFLSKVTEDILRSGVYSDKAIIQAFEFHMQFYKDDSNKEKLQSLLQQVLEGLKVSNDDAEENFHPKKAFLFSLSRPNTPPEKENSATLFSSDSSPTANELNSTLNEPVSKINEDDDS